MKTSIALATLALLASSPESKATLVWSWSFDSAPATVSNDGSTVYVPATIVNSAQSTERLRGDNFPGLTSSFGFGMSPLLPSATVGFGRGLPFPWTDFNQTTRNWNLAPGQSINFTFATLQYNAGQNQVGSIGGIPAINASGRPAAILNHVTRGANGAIQDDIRAATNDFLFSFVNPASVPLNPNRTAWTNPLGSTLGFASTMNLSFEHNAFVFHMNIDYAGQDIDAHRLHNYEEGIERYWSDVRMANIDGLDIPIVFDVNFLDANQGRHANSNAFIEINNETCGDSNRSNVIRWCLNQPGELVTDTQQMQLAAHEFGHLGLGLIDEYDDLLDPRFPLGSQVHLSDQLGNVCHYAGAFGYRFRTGAWCNDMMAVAGGSTANARYFEQIESYIAGVSGRPSLQFGFAPVLPGILSMPVSTFPPNDTTNVSEPPSSWVVAATLLALALQTRRTRDRLAARPVSGA